jgi:hypothetical protein
MKPFGPSIVFCHGSVLDDAQEKSPLTSWLPPAPAVLRLALLEEAEEMRALTAEGRLKLPRRELDRNDDLVVAR